MSVQLGSYGAPADTVDRTSKSHPHRPPRPWRFATGLRAVDSITDGVAAGAFSSRQTAKSWAHGCLRDFAESGVQKKKKTTSYLGSPSFFFLNTGNHGTKLLFNQKGRLSFFPLDFPLPRFFRYQCLWQKKRKKANAAKSGSKVQERKSRFEIFVFALCLENIRSFLCRKN